MDCDRCKAMLDEGNFEKALECLSMLNNGISANQADESQIQALTALAHYNLGKVLFNEGCDAEQDLQTNRSEEAKLKFKEAQKHYEEAEKLDQKYKSGMRTLQKKLNGNAYFAKGAKMQDETNQMLLKMVGEDQAIMSKAADQYDLARKSYEKAKKKFSKSDDRFCAFTDKAIDSVQSISFKLRGLLIVHYMGKVTFQKRTTNMSQYHLEERRINERINKFCVEQQW